MAIVYNEKQRREMIEMVQGKTVQSLQFVEAEDGCPSYWVMTFITDGLETEMSFRFMAEIFEG